MNAILTALLVATHPADTTESGQCRFRAEVWEVGNAVWASALDTMESPGAWRQRLLLAPGSRLTGSWVLSFAPGSTAEAISTRERIFPVEYVARGGLSGSEPREPRVPARPDSLLGMFEGWLRAKAHKDFEVRDEGWDFRASCRAVGKERCLLKIELSEVKLRGFSSFGSNPFAMPQAAFHRFSVNVTRSMHSGRWEILAAQEAPAAADGTRGGSNGWCSSTAISHPEACACRGATVRRERNTSRPPSRAYRRGRPKSGRDAGGNWNHGPGGQSAGRFLPSRQPSEGRTFFWTQTKNLGTL